MKHSIIGLVSGLVLAVAATNGAAAQTNNLGVALAASNVIRLSADTTRTGGLGMTKEFIVPYAGIVRVWWQIKSNESGKVATVSAAGQIGNCTDSSTAQIFVTQSCDLRVVAGDRILVTASGQVDLVTFINSSVSLRNVRLKWNVVNATGAGAVLLD